MESALLPAPRATRSVVLDRDLFLRDLVREVAGTLQDVVGLEEANGFLSVVGQRLGERLAAAYSEEFGQDNMDRETVAQILVDLKRRIDGDFHIIDQDDEKITLGNRRCPFGRQVEGRPALCTITSNVFGVIAAQSLGYAKVEIQESIATGHAGCRVVVHLKPTVEAEAVEGREYYSG